MKEIGGWDLATLQAMPSHRENRRLIEGSHSQQRDALHRTALVLVRVP